MRPGVPGWENVEDPYAAIEIPERVYKSMTTEALAESCLKVPLRSDLYAFNTLEDGFARILARSSAMRELLSRADVGATLLQKYRAIDLQELISRGKTRKYSFVDYAFLHQMIKREEVLSRLDVAQATALAEEALNCLRVVRTAVGPSATDDHPAALLAKLFMVKGVILPSSTDGEDVARVTPEAIAGLARAGGARSELITAILNKYPARTKK